MACGLLVGRCAFSAFSLGSFEIRFCSFTNIWNKTKKRSLSHSVDSTMYIDVFDFMKSWEKNEDTNHADLCTEYFQRRAANSPTYPLD